MRRVKGLNPLFAAAEKVKLTGRRCVLRSLIGRLKNALADADEALSEEIAELGCFLAAVLHNKPCHCCIIFTRRSHLALYRNRFLKRLDFDHGHRESGLSPPSAL